jgi:hypothetical protein
MWLKPGPSVMTQIMISPMKMQYLAYRICNSHRLHVIGLEESANRKLLHLQQKPMKAINQNGQKETTPWKL